MTLSSCSRGLTARANFLIYYYWIGYIAWLWLGETFPTNLSWERLRLRLLSEDLYFVFKKRETWSGALADFKSQIRYSPISSGSSRIIWAVARMARHTITDRNGNPNVFNLNRDENGLWLNDNWANPQNKWNLDNELMFRLRKYFFSALKKCGFSFLDWLDSSSNRQAFFRSIARIRLSLEFQMRIC